MQPGQPNPSNQFNQATPFGQTGPQQRSTSRPIVIVGAIIAAVVTLALIVLGIGYMSARSETKKVFETCGENGSGLSQKGKSLVLKHPGPPNSNNYMSREYQRAFECLITETQVAVS